MVAKSCIPCRTRIAARRDEEVQRVLVTNKPTPLFLTQRALTQRATMTFFRRIRLLLFLVVLLLPTR